MENSSLAGSTDTAGAVASGTQEVTEGQAPGMNSSPENGESVLQSGQNTAQPAKQASIWDYKTDPRWGKVWKKEGDIIQGYKSLDDILEKKYKPTFKQYEDLQKKFKEYGIESEKFDEYFKEYQTLKSPEHPTNQVFNRLKELVEGDDLAAQDLQLALNKIHEDKLSRKYPGLNKDAREKIIAQEKQLKELENWKKTTEMEKLNEASTERATKGIDAIQKLCQSKGFDFTDEIRKEFIDHCIKEGISTKYMLQEFRNVYDDTLDKVHEEKIKAATLETLQKKNATTIPGKPRMAPPAGKEESLEEGFKKLFAARKK